MKTDVTTEVAGFPTNSLSGNFDGVFFLENQVHLAMQLLLCDVCECVCVCVHF